MARPKKKAKTKIGATPTTGVIVSAPPPVVSGDEVNFAAHGATGLAHKKIIGPLTLSGTALCSRYAGSQWGSAGCTTCNS